MTRTSSSGKAVAVRIAALLVVGVVAIILVMVIRSPFGVHEQEVREILATDQLIGLPLEEAAVKLHHRPPDPPVIDGKVLFDFDHISGWRAPAVEVEVRGGRVVAAEWQTTPAEEFR